MGLLPLCRGDPLVDTLREFFDATPLRVPDARVRPLAVVVSDGKRSQFLGPLADLLQDGREFDVAAACTDLAAFSGRRSRSVDIELGLQILDGFLSPFGLSPPTVRSRLSGARSLSFAFGDVQRLYIETTRLGRVLGECRIDFRNVATTVIRGSVLIVDSVLRCSEFSVTVDRAIGAVAEIDSAVAADLVDVSGLANISMTSGHDLTFSRPDPLTFAFSCVRVFVDHRGFFTGVSPGAVPTSAGFGPGLSIETLKRATLSDTPALLSWDE